MWELEMAVCCMHACCCAPVVLLCNTMNEPPLVLVSKNLNCAAFLALCVCVVGCWVHRLEPPTSAPKLMTTPYSFS